MSSYLLKAFPSREELLLDFQGRPEPPVPHINAHVHTPFSFSSFRSIPELFRQARQEEVKVLGINDFYLTEGFGECHDQALEHRIFPMFNIEIVGLLTDEQYQKFRINDPVNPGRTYLSGKGLDFPFELDPVFECMLHNTRYENQLHTKGLIEQAAAILKARDPGMNLKFSEIRRLYAKDFVTERHVARAIREMIEARYSGSDDRKAFLKSLYRGRESEADLSDAAGLENEIRARFLKSGGLAFLPEESSAFLPVRDVIQIILNAGGIPCYTVLLDDGKGRCTEYEANKQILANELEAHGIYCIEFIPRRNSPEILEDYVQFFRERDFVILFGTAHSTPEAQSLRIQTRGAKPLDDNLRRINYEGAAVIAAHQYLRARDEDGYVSLEGTPSKKALQEFIGLGKAVIQHFIGV